MQVHMAQAGVVQDRDAYIIIAQDIVTQICFVQVGVMYVSPIHVKAGYYDFAQVSATQFDNRVVRFVYRDCRVIHTNEICFIQKLYNYCFSSWV